MKNFSFLLALALASIASAQQGYDIRKSTVTASKFIATGGGFVGNGSGLTNLPGGGGGVTAASSPTWTGSHSFLGPIATSSSVVFGGATATQKINIGVGPFGSTFALNLAGITGGITSGQWNGLSWDWGMRFLNTFTPYSNIILENMQTSGVIQIYNDTVDSVVRLAGGGGKELTVGTQGTCLAPVADSCHAQTMLDVHGTVRIANGVAVSTFGSNGDVGFPGNIGLKGLIVTTATGSNFAGLVPYQLNNVTGSGGGIYPRAAGEFGVGVSTNLNVNQDLGGIYARGYGDTGYSNVSDGVISLTAAEKFHDGMKGTKLRVRLTPLGGSAKFLVGEWLPNNFQINSNLTSTGTVSAAAVHSSGTMTVNGNIIGTGDVNMGGTGLFGGLVLAGDIVQSGVTHLDTDLNLNASSGTFSGTVTSAGGFIGDGSGLTNISHSSFTIVPNTTFTNTAFGPCISTVTITVGLGPIFIAFQGTGSHSLPNGLMSFSVLQDGAFNHTTTIGALSSVSGMAIGGEGNLGFTHIHSEGMTTPGVHSFCLAPRVDGGTGTLLFDANHYTNFGAWVAK